MVRFRLLPGEAKRNGMRFPRFSHPGWFAAPQWAAPHNFVATTGLPIREDGTQECEDLTLAARNALLEMILLLGERGFSREQAYVICSLAVDLRSAMRSICPMSRSAPCCPKRSSSGIDLMARCNGLLPLDGFHSIVCLT